MSLSEDLIYEFVKVTNDTEPIQNEDTIYGTVVKYDSRYYVKLDGSDQLTPVTSTVSVEDGDRVIVKITKHNATVTGNTTDPSASTKKVEKMGTQISEFEIIISDKVVTTDLEAINAYIDRLIAVSGRYEDLEVVTAEIETLKAKYADMDHISAADAEILNAEIESLKTKFLQSQQISAEDLEAVNAEITNLLAYNASFTYVSAEVLKAVKATIKDLDVKKLNADDAKITYATIDDLDAEHANVEALDADFSNFKDAYAEDFKATNASIENLQAEKLDAEQASLKFANIDFSNIGKAAMEYFYAQSGLIRDVIIDQGTITGNLVGVTIKGDLIEGGTVKADKLVIKGEDGLFYKLNTDGETVEAQQTDANSLNGQVITAKSITAEKISVSDLVAFDATIGGYNITEDAIYSGVKESVDNTTQGVYFDREGQMALGDETQYIKYYKDEDGKYRLEITGRSVKIGTSDKTIDELYVNDFEMNFITNFITSQTHDQKLQKYYPDYTLNPYVIAAEVKNAIDETQTTAVFTWKRKGQSDDIYTDLIDGETFQNEELTISHNLTETVEYKAIATITPKDGSVYTVEKSIILTLNAIPDDIVLNVTGKVCQVEATSTTFVEKDDIVEPGMISLIPYFVNCNFDMWSYSTDLGETYVSIVPDSPVLGNLDVEPPTEETEEPDQPEEPDTSASDEQTLYSTNVESVSIDMTNNVLYVDADCPLFELSAAIVFRLKADVRETTDTVVIVKENDIAAQVGSIVEDMNVFVENYNSVVQELNAQNNTITERVTEIENTYNDDFKELNEKMSQVLQNAEMIEERFSELREIVNDNGSSLESITTYIRKTIKGIEVGELDANVKTLMAPSYFAILFNDEEVMKLEQSLLTIERIKALTGFQLGNSIFNANAHGFDITWGGE